MKNLLFLRSYFLFKEKLVAHENIQLLRPESERSQVSGGFKVWAFSRQRRGFCSGRSCLLQRKMWVLLPVSAVPQFQQLTEETTAAELIWQLWMQIKNLTNFFLETDDVTLPHLDVKLTCGNTFKATYLMKKYWWNTFSHVSVDLRNHQLSSDDSLVTAHVTSWCISG